MCIDYLTKWAETKAVKVATKEKVVEFFRENVFYKFGYPRDLVTDQGTQFTSHMIENLLSRHNIKHKKSTPYHPQANGQVEFTNRALESILRKVVSSSRKYFADRLVEATTSLCSENDILQGTTSRLLFTRSPPRCKKVYQLV